MDIIEIPRIDGLSESDADKLSQRVYGFNDCLSMICEALFGADGHRAGEFPKTRALLNEFFADKMEDETSIIRWYYTIIAKNLVEESKEGQNE